VQHNDVIIDVHVHWPGVHGLVACVCHYLEVFDGPCSDVFQGAVESSTSEAAVVPGVTAVDGQLAMT